MQRKGTDVMEKYDLSKIQPTWEIVGFNEKMADIPCKSVRYRRNPLDKRVAIFFLTENPNRDKCYLPMTNEARILDANERYDCDKLSKLFRTEVTGIQSVKNLEVKSFLYAMVIGDSYVFRKFEITYKFDENSDGDYECSISPIKEVCRYVFHGRDIYLETKEKTREIITGNDIEEKAYDISLDGDAEFVRSLFQDFRRKVQMDYKEEILKALSAVALPYSKVGFDVFLKVYRKALEKGAIDKAVPKRIIRELYDRKHNANTAVRIEKDLVVVTGESECKYLKTKEPFRIYFDSKESYYFRKNLITGEWLQEDLFSLIRFNNGIRYRVYDQDIFNGTCMQKYARYAVEESIPSGRKINFGFMVVQSCFLVAEQAAKIKMDILPLILENIYSGKITDRFRALPESLGVSGPQLKFLKDTNLPRDLEKFRQYMVDENFKTHFEDVKKRIFAVSFYLRRDDSWNAANRLSQDDIFEAAQTLNSLEKSDWRLDDRLLGEYYDYLNMRKSYMHYIEHMPADESLCQEILAIGEVPANLKPSKIRDYHHKLSTTLSLIKRAEKIEKYGKGIKDRKRNDAQKFEYTNGKYSMVMPKDVMEIIQEGRTLCHCVGSAGYIERMARNECTILFLRDNRALDSPLITIEERDGVIQQCYGYRNSYNHEEEIRDFIQDYAIEHNLNVKAVIYQERGQ